MQKGWPIPTQVGGWQHLTCLLHTAATPTMSEFCALMRRCAVELLRQSEEDRSRLRPNGDARTMEAIIWEYNDRDQSSRQRPKTSGTFCAELPGPHGPSSRVETPHQQRQPESPPQSRPSSLQAPRPEGRDWRGSYQR